MKRNVKQRLILYSINIFQHTIQFIHATQSNAPINSLSTIQSIFTTAINQSDIYLLINHQFLWTTIFYLSNFFSSRVNKKFQKVTKMKRQKINEIKIYRNIFRNFQRIKPIMSWKYLHRRHNRYHWRHLQWQFSV